jgi:hypothetical protein
MGFLFLKSHISFCIRKSTFRWVQFRTNSTKSTAITFDMLRPYQKECIETTLKEYKNDCNRQAVSLPVGKVH